MSGIFGFINVDGAPACDDSLQQMATILARRGPDGASVWHEGSVGLGHTLLATTPEALFENIPLEHAESGCVITADARLDNRDELLATLGMRDRAVAMGDAEIILLMYIRWGEPCVERLLGDFAFAIWDPRRRRIFCARDQIGMRPFYYHHAPGRFFAFASEPRAILALARTPYRINEGRIADFLIVALEDIDFTSTFFEDVYRLSPAHTLSVTHDGARLQRYWRPEPGQELRLASDDDYAEAFLDVFTEAVRCRLRSTGRLGSMLSGGLDSGSVVAIARTLLSQAGRGPLHTISATNSDPSVCIETRTIHTAMAMDNLEPHTVSLGALDDFAPDLEDLTWDLEEPFDNEMTLPRAVYLSAKRNGINVLLDGVGSDVVLAEGSYLSRLLRSGRWLTACQEAFGKERFWGGAYPAWQGLYQSARTAFIPKTARLMRQRFAGAVCSRKLDRLVTKSVINPDFARRVSLGKRLQTTNGRGSDGLLADYRSERAQAIDQPFLVAARERYGRVAASVAVEPRDPFLDRRVITLCLSLPGEQRLKGGWPKIVLRRAMAGQLPDAVRWRRGKTHLGLSFTLALMERNQERIRSDIQTNRGSIAPYLNMKLVDQVLAGWHQTATADEMLHLWNAVHLGLWLKNHSPSSRKPLLRTA